MVSFLLLLTLLIVATDAGLYDDAPEVLSLNADNFHSYVYNDNRAYFIQYYLSWCGGCKTLAPVWKQFASDLATWNDIVQIAAFDCNSPKEYIFCKNRKVGLTPHIRYYSFSTDSAFDAAVFKGDKYDTEYMRGNLAWLVATDPKKPNGLTMFEPLPRNANLEDKAGPSTELVAVVFQKYRNDIANQLALEFSKQKKVDVFGASHNHPLLAGKTTTLPAMFVFKKGYFHWPDFVSEKPIDRKSAADIIEKFTEEQDWGKTSNKSKQLEKIQRVAKQPSAATYATKTDLESALAYVLRIEIPWQQTIQGDRLQKLQAFLRVLSKYYPGTSDQSIFLTQLYAWTKDRQKIESKDWSSAVQNLELLLFPTALPKSLQWDGCKGSKPHFRGYPCALWALFHVMTVEAYKQDATSSRFDPVAILEAINGYVEGFFTCSECVKHYGYGAKTMPEHVSEARDAVLWLWSQHNRHNFYLAGEPSEDPLYPKVQFPEKHICPECQDEEGNWEKSKVLTFLLNLYSDLE